MGFTAFNSSYNVTIRYFASIARSIHTGTWSDGFSQLRT
jgi:hypothetical protein